MPSVLRSAALELRAAGRVAVRGGGGLRERLGTADERLVFVVGCPRSGTTFLGGALGSLPGFVDLGEVAPLKAAIPELAGGAEEVTARRIRRILDRTRRFGLVGARRAVEQTPETVFVAAAALRAYPDARVVHLVRDGRDVVCSLLERGWLNAARTGADDAGLAYGPAARFWVEPERREEFRRVSDARRAAWAWRRYVTAGRDLRARALELRYERLVAAPDAAAAELAAYLGAPEAPLAEALRRAHGGSVGRYTADLTAEQLADVTAEAGETLAGLGYG